MTDLTEKSKIKEGYYYAIVNGEQNIVKKVRGLKHPYCNGFCCDCYKYLSPVPSYDEWFKIKNLASLTSLLQEKNIECLHRENKLKELLKECKRQFEEVELCRYDIADTDQEDWFKISTEQAGIANKIIAKINQVLGEDK